MSCRPEVPPLPFHDWERTKTTRHLWSQIVGKVRMATSPPRNHWWHAALYVDVRGLTTRRLHADGITFQIDFDFVDHRLVVRTTGGAVSSFPLHEGLSVAEFDEQLHGTLDRLGVDVQIRESPFGVPVTTPFREDTEHRSYDADSVSRFWRVLDWSDSVLEEFAGWYCGKTSPVHLFWHSFDLALTRFGRRRAPPLPDADPVTREAYSHELVSFGFWAGDERIREPTYYAYAHPEPPDLCGQPLQPDGVAWVELNGSLLATVPYDVVRAAVDPRAALLSFLRSTYDAGASLAGWDRADLESSWCPTPAELDALPAG